MTQDLGTAQLKYDDFKSDKSVYIVGNEQEYHFNVLKIILAKLEKAYADTIVHLSYGMVDLPEGKMKSREGTVVDADDLMDEMHQTALDYISDSGKILDMSEEEREILSETVGLGALKYFILKTDIRKRMVFNPKESIDFQGHTGPFVQYTYARIQSVLRKSNVENIASLQIQTEFKLEVIEKELLKKIFYFNDAIAEAEKAMDPSQLANYVYQLAKIYNKFYHDFNILKEPNEELKLFRLKLSYTVAEIIKTCMLLLGIQVPERM
jgi:arginyl-tRNA synthetase